MATLRDGPMISTKLVDLWRSQMPDSFPRTIEVSLLRDILLELHKIEFHLAVEARRREEQGE
jgi:hypothetical protein